MRRKNKYRKAILSIFIFLFLLFSVAYSAFNTKLSINTKGNLKGNTYKSLIKKAVTSGDGLYQDSVEPNKYFYKGANPNNYLLFNNDLYRIININEDGSLRIIKNDSIGDMKFDDDKRSNSRYSSLSTDYCSYTNNEDEYHGCNIWGSKYTMLDSSENLITKMPRNIDEDKLYDLPEKEAYINDYLNNIWFQSLSEKKFVEKAIYNVGILSYKNLNQSFNDSIIQEEKYKWKGYVGLINISDYPRTNTNINDCGTIWLNSQAYNNYNICKMTSWMYDGDARWSLTPRSDITYDISYINISGCFYSGAAYVSRGAYPVLTLKSDLTLSYSKGSVDDPYKIIN